MKDFLREYFYHTKSERRGAFVLALLCVLLFLLPQAYPWLLQDREAAHQVYADSVRHYLERIPEEAAEAAAEPEAQLFYFDPNTLPQDSLVLLGLPRRTAQTIVKFRNKVRPFRRPEDLLDIYTLSEGDYNRLAPYIRIRKAPPSSSEKSEPEPMPEAQLFPFDPNTLAGDSLQLLGLRGRTVRTLLNYREKGGRFYQKEDLKKVYGLRPETYERLKPFIQIEAPTEKAEAPTRAEPVAAHAKAPPPEPISIDINRASPEQWQQLRGIGPAYARRICNFREKLGGFAQIEQVAETYGLPDSTFQRLRPQLRLSPVFRQININTANAAGLQAHPYLSWKQANALVAYRNQHDRFATQAEVAKVRALPPELHRKMAPYWRFD